MTDLAAALALLDPRDDSLWTSDGAVRLDAVRAVVGAPVTRAQVIEAAPGFSRQARAAELGVSIADGAAPLGEPPPPADGGHDGEGPAEVAGHVTAGGGGSVDGIEPEEFDASTPEGQYVAVSLELEAAMVERDVLDERIRRLSAEQERLAPHAPPGQRSRGHREDTEARMAWVRAQAEQRAARIEQSRRALAAAGIAGKSTLDRAMARDRRFGARRPDFSGLVEPAPAGG